MIKILFNKKMNLKEIIEDNKISIIICHYTGDLIDNCLNSLEKIEAKKIVITSKKDTIYQADLTLYEDRNEPTYKRNLGVTRSRSEYLVFMDDDVEIKYDCIKRMEEYLDENSDTGMVYAMLYKMDNHNKIDTSGSFLTWSGFLYETYLNPIIPCEIISGKSALCMIRRGLFVEIGGFDEDFVIYGEETDLSWRVWLAGYKVMVLPHAIGYHAFETSLKPRSFYNQYYIHYHGCKNYITMLIKNLPANKLYIVLINAFIWLIMGFFMLFRNRQASKWIWQGIGYNIKNFKYIWQKRKSIKRLDNGFFRCIQRNPPISYYLGRCKDYLTHQLHG